MLLRSPIGFNIENMTGVVPDPGQTSIGRVVGTGGVERLPIAILFAPG